MLLTNLHDYLNKHKDKPRIQDLPRLNEDLLKRARNCIPWSVDNNDLLEFIGDRVVNLLCAVLVEDVRLSKAHHRVGLPPYLTCLF
jgi:dsRNA-specific ribonuclease